MIAEEYSLNQVKVKARNTQALSIKCFALVRGIRRLSLECVA
jgi:hypothetical protein